MLQYFCSQVNLLSTQIEDLKHKLPPPSSPTAAAAAAEQTGGTDAVSSTAAGTNEDTSVGNLSESAAPVTQDQMQTSQDQQNSSVNHDEDDDNDSSPNASVNTSQEKATPPDNEDSSAVEQVVIQEVKDSPGARDEEKRKIIEKCRQLEELNAGLELRLAAAESSKPAPPPPLVASPASNISSSLEQSEKVIKSLRIELRKSEEERENLKQDVERLSAATSTAVPSSDLNVSSSSSCLNSSLPPETEERINQLLKVKEKFVEISQDKSQLEQSFQELEKEVETLTLQSQTATACCLIPLAIIILAVIIAYLPILAPALGTSDQV